MNGTVQIGKFLVNVDGQHIAASLLGAGGEVVDQKLIEHDFGNHPVSINAGEFEETGGNGQSPRKVPSVQITALEFESALHILTAQGERIRPHIL